MTEFAYIQWLRKQLSTHTPTLRLPLGPGDDASVLANGLLMASDMLLEGTHFDLAKTPAYLVGRKALAVNLSDIAAMAGTPEAVVVSLGLPRASAHGSTQQIAQDLFSGIVALASQHDVAIAGGDTTSWDGPLVINIGIMGRTHLRGSVTRAGARPGDMIFISGPLGGSIFGRHLLAIPRLDLARRMHQNYGLTAMIDLSDGLGSDLRHICHASSQNGPPCLAKLQQHSIPIHPDVYLHAANPELLTHSAATSHALSDGEDFELCFTLTADAGQRLLADIARGLAPPLSYIGDILPAKEQLAQLIWQDDTPILQQGYAHSW